MRKIILLSICAGTLTFLACGQSIKTSQVPGKVKEALVNKYPASAHVKVTWEKENGNYEANWGGKSGEDNSIQFTPAGVFVSEEIAVSTSALPQPVSAYLQKNYKGDRIHEAGKITDAHGSITFEVEVKGKVLVLDPSGKLIRTEKGD